MSLSRRTMHGRLFFHFSLVICLVLTVCFLLFYAYFSAYCADTVALAQGNLCSSVVESIDTQIQQMNTVSMNLIYSNLVASKFQGYLAQRPREAASSDVWRNAYEVFDVIWAIIGPFQTVSQVNLYSPTGTVIGSGIYNYEDSVDLKSLSWYRPTVALAGSRYLGQPEKLAAMDLHSAQLKDHRFVPLCRVFYSDRYEFKGIVEILQDSARIFAHTEELKRLNPSVEVFVLNDQGVQIYPDPGKGSSEGPSYRKFIPMAGTRTEGDRVLTALHSEVSGWDMIVVQPWVVAFEPLERFTVLLVAVSIILLVLGWFSAFFLARYLNGPIIRLQAAFEGLQAQAFLDPGLGAPAFGPSGIREIDALNGAFRGMYEKLRDSTTALVQARSEETRAQMLALQSLMNPHFIHNNLAAISALAEVGMTPQIVAMCGDIAGILRYISSDGEAAVTVAEEMSHTLRYLQCMTLSHGEALSWQTDIPPDLGAVVLPKLIVQPLVENSLVHGFNVPPPWKLDIFGRIDGERWEITISDNGIGFEPSVLESLEGRVGAWKRTGRLPPLGLHGMGLLNIRIRLHLFYGPDHVFLVGPRPGGGTVVTVGGLVDARNR